jgi:hypothetical protein
VTAAQFQAIFGQSVWIIIGGVVAFALSQLVDFLSSGWFATKPVTVLVPGV